MFARHGRRRRGSGPVRDGQAASGHGAAGRQGFDWYAEKVTVPPAARHGVMQGVVWAIPREMFELLGGRLTGSLALSFIPSAAVGQTQ